MNDKGTVDVLEGIARMNPVPDDHLDEGQQVRSEAILARIVESGGRGSEVAAVDRGSRASVSDAPVPAGMHVAHAAPARGRSGPGRVLRGLAIALASVLGLGAAAYATGVTPGAIEIGRQVFEGADNGTVTYSYVPVEDGNAVLSRIATNAAASPDLGDPAQVIEVHTLNRIDGWESDDTAPVSQENERWDWVLLDGSRRVRSDWSTRPDNLAGSLEYPSEGNEDVRAIDLGTTIEATLAELNHDERPDRATWAVVDRYVQLWGQGVGLRATDRAAFIRALAAGEHTSYGPATDSLGRTGEAFGVSWNQGGSSDEQRVVLDPSNGAVLASERVLHGLWILGSKDRVQSSTTFVSVGSISTLDSCDETQGCEVMPPPG